MRTASPEDLLIIGAICTITGIVLIKRGIEGDTLMPDTTFTYLPRWLFISCGILLQFPIVGAYLLLQYLDRI